MNDAHSRHLEGVKKAKCSEITKKYVLQSEGRARQCHGRSSEKRERQTLIIKMIPADQPCEWKHRHQCPGFNRPNSIPVAEFSRARCMNVMCLGDSSPDSKEKFLWGHSNLAMLKENMK